MIAPLIMACVVAVGEPAALRLATYSYSTLDRAAALRPLATALQAAYRRPVTVSVYPSPRDLAEAMRGGDVDVAVTNLASYAAMADAPALRPVAVLDPPAGRLETYRGALIARRDRALGDLGAVKARAGALRYVEALPGSTSGALVQAYRLRGEGVRVEDFARRTFAGSHDAALTHLLEDKADLGAMTAEAWRRLQAERPAEAARLVEVWRSDPLPPGPVVCRASAAVDCAVAARVLLDDAHEAARALAAAWPETEGAVSFKSPAAEIYAPFLAPTTRAGAATAPPR